ncbi:MAG: ATP-binding cassette domain-containing protein, partial [Nitrobacter sp.]
RILSLGEQQRLGLARALLHRPDYLFLDEATASLDEPSETALYRLIAEKLPATTVVSIGHRNTLEAFHQDKVVLEPADDRFAIHSVKEPARAAT